MRQHPGPIAALSFALSFTLLTARPAHAAGVSILGFGVDVDAETLAVLSQLVIMTGQAAELGRKTQEGLTTAEETLRAVREANEAVKSTVYLVQNPDEVMNDARESFLLSFHELDGINREAAALYESVTTAPTGFDLRTYRRAFEQAAQTATSYETFLAFREKDYGLLGQQALRTTAGIEVTLDQDRQLQRRLERTESLSQKEAAAISAKADVDTAVSANVSARQLTELLRLEQLRFMDEQSAFAAKQAERADRVGAFQTSTDSDPTLPLDADDDIANTTNTTNTNSTYGHKNGHKNGGR